MSTPPGNKVSVVFLVEDGLYLVEHFGWGIKLCVNGIEAPPGRLVVSDPKVLGRCVVHPAPLLHYVNATDPSVTMSPERYAAERAELVRDREDEEGDIDFESLDHEYAYKKFMATWRPVHGESKVEIAPVEVDVVEIRRESGDPHIRSLWNAPDVVESKRGLYELNVLAAGLHAFRERCQRHSVTFEIPSHGGLEFAKINGAYVFSGRGYVQPKVAFIGTLEQCRERKREEVAMVTKAVDLARAKQSTNPITEVGALIEKLEDIGRRLSLVSAQSSSRAAFSVARGKLSDLVESLVKEAA